MFSEGIKATVSRWRNIYQRTYLGSVGQEIREMEKGTETILWQVAVAVGGSIAGFIAAFRRFSSLPKTVNGNKMAMIAIETEVSRVLKRMRDDMEKSFQEHKEDYRELAERVRQNSLDIRDIKRRLDTLEDG